MIGSTGDTTATGSKAGLEEVDTKVSIGKVLDMVMEFTDSTLAIVTLVNGSMVRAMGLVFNLVLMVAVSNMDLDLTTSGKLIVESD